MQTLYKIGLVILSLGFLLSCQQTSNKKIASVQTTSDSIRKIYAPDKRVAIYDLNFEMKNGKLFVDGETDQEEALKILFDQLESKGLIVENHTTQLPDSTVGQFTYAIVTNSVANIRSQPKHSGELATQAILGTSLKVLKINGDFYLVQSPDGYISWVDHGGVTLLTDAQFTSWNNSPKVIFTNTSGFVYQEPNNDLKKIGDIVLGGQLLLMDENTNYYKVQYPDKREGFLKKSESNLYDTWLKQVQASG